MHRLEDYLSDDDFLLVTGKRKEKFLSFDEMEKQLKSDEIANALSLLRSNGYSVRKKGKTKRKSKRKK